MSAQVDSLPVAWLRRLGSMSLFFVQVCARSVSALSKPGLIVRQIYNAGARSLVIVMLSGLFVGMVLGLLGFDTLQRFGSEDSLGVLAALGMLKVLGPVLTALLFAGRAGTSLTSEIGLMKSTDQLTAMQMMAVDPLRHVIAPRFLGGIIAMPLLAATFTPVRSGRRRRTPSTCATSPKASSRAWCSAWPAVSSPSTRVITASPRPRASASRRRARWSHRR
jgi:ABC transport permease subunit